MNYFDVDKPEIIKGIKVWKNPKNKFAVMMLHLTADPDKDPERNGAEWYAREKEGTSKAQWAKEYDIDFTTKSGKIIFGPDFCDYNPSLGYQNPHWIEPFEWEEPCEMLMSLDFGQRNPTCALVGVWTKDNRLIIVDEYYKPNLPSNTSKELFVQFDYLLSSDPEFRTGSINTKRMAADARFQIKVIDPTTTYKNRSTNQHGEEIPYSIHEEFYDNGWEFELADNDVNAGITRVREYMKVDRRSGLPRLMFMKGKCPNLMRELANYRYKTLTPSQLKMNNEKEEPMKKDDHAVDALRYLLMTRPVNPATIEAPQNRIQKDIQNLLRPKNSASSFDDDSR